MLQNRRLYPIGLQDFEKIRKENRVYVDKTALIYELTHTNSMYFLSRPRRFGKSLLLSTLKAYFEGKKELFDGLAMEKLETEWEKHPVMHIDFSVSKYTCVDDLRQRLNSTLEDVENIYGCQDKSANYTERFTNVIKKAYETTGKSVVVLIDEYDSPLLDSNDSQELQKQLRDEVRKFYSPLKHLGYCLRFLLITGISKFSQVSIFSELNNLLNISMQDEYAAICGVTKEELLTQMKPDIETLAKANEETYEEAVAHLKQMYDGYHFSKNSPDIFNPFSLINAFNTREYDNYWFQSGTPTFLINILKQAQIDIRLFEGVDATAEQFDKPTENVSDPIPVLYQSGYLTIKGYDKMFRSYKLAYPNEEVRTGLLMSLLPNYVDKYERDNSFYIQSFIKDLMRGDVDSCMERTRSFFADIPYDLENKTEKHYQTIFYMLFRLMGQFVETEVKSARGRADAVVKTSDTVYVFEFKFDGSAQEALEQINSKGYTIAYEAGNKKIVKVGINFSSQTRTVEEWVVG